MEYYQSSHGFAGHNQSSVRHVFRSPYQKSGASSASQSSLRVSASRDGREAGLGGEAVGVGGLGDEAKPQRSSSSTAEESLKDGGTGDSDDVSASIPPHSSEEVDCVVAAVWASRFQETLLAAREGLELEGEGLELEGVLVEPIMRGRAPG